MQVCGRLRAAALHASAGSAAGSRQSGRVGDVVPRRLPSWTVPNPAGTFKPERLFGVTTLDVVRAETFIAEILGVDPKEVQVGARPEAVQAAAVLVCKCACAVRSGWSRWAVVAALAMQPLPGRSSTCRQAQLHSQG